uniref:Uncharacterized protein n=1 Tax=Knipowitschia caucasica TaxID=637954 RepID=A0AAV2K876_KNICA
MSHRKVAEMLRTTAARRNSRTSGFHQAYGRHRDVTHTAAGLILRLRMCSLPPEPSAQVQSGGRIRTGNKRRQGTPPVQPGVAAEAGMDDDADWEDWDASPMDVFWDENSDWDDALVPDDEEDYQDTKSEEEDQDTEGEEDNQTPLAGARRHRDEEEDEEDNQTVPEWSPSSPSPDLVPSRPPLETGVRSIQHVPMELPPMELPPMELPPMELPPMELPPMELPLMELSKGASVKHHSPHQRKMNKSTQT